MNLKAKLIGIGGILLSLYGINEGKDYPNWMLLFLFLLSLSLHNILYTQYR